MNHPGRFRLRILSGAILLATTVVAALVFVLWSDPSAAIQSLRGKPLARVRSEQVLLNGRVQEATRITTTGGLELDLIVLRPNDPRPVPLVILALDSADLLAATQSVPKSEVCAFALLSCAFEDDRLFDLRSSSERVAASLLAAWDEYHEKPWVAVDEVHFLGQERTAPPAILAAKLLGPKAEAWMLGTLPGKPTGLRDRAAFELAFGGSRALAAVSSEQPPADLATGLEWLQDRLTSNP